MKRNISEIPTYRVTDSELVSACSVDNDWAATELGVRLENCRDMLMRCSTVLSHMAVERKGSYWRRFWNGRWLIHHEPLRSDAASLLPLVMQLTKREGL